MARKDHEPICFEFAFACVVDKNPKTPKLSSMADDNITRGDIGSLVSLVYICGHIHIYPEGCLDRLTDCLFLLICCDFLSF